MTYGFDGSGIASHHTFLLPPEALVRRNPYYLNFCVDGFLDAETDFKLRTEFPTDVMKSLLGSRLSINLNLDEDSETVREFFKRSPEWHRYYSAFTSPEWLTATIREFRSEFVNRYPRCWRWLVSRRVLDPRNLKVTMAFSLSRTGFILAPHSDDKFKVLTLIHYLPESDGGETTGGTQFYLPKSGANMSDSRRFSEWSRGLRRFLPIFKLAPSTDISLERRYEKGDLPSEVERAAFDQLFEAGDYFDYRANRISGFVKNKLTLHEVDLSDFPDSQFRRAALVNVRLRPTLWSQIIPYIERVLLTIKHKIR